jgi:hypothetical protein
MKKTVILQCIKELESKLAELREAVEKLPNVTEAPQPMQFVDKGKLSSLIAKAFEEMGIQGQPIGAEKVQEMIAACGVKPEDNVFSKGIVEMREE